MSAAQNWKQLYSVTTESIGESLHDARARQLKHYKNICSRHGGTIFLVVDNSCPHCTAENNKRRRTDNPLFNRPREALGTIRRRAKQKGIECTLSINDIRGHIPNHCPVLGTVIEYVTGDVDASMSVDRLDNSLGYTPSNIRLISTRANRIKSDGTIMEHLQIALWMARETGVTRTELRELCDQLIKGNANVN